jgi:hypothetical protein
MQRVLLTNLTVIAEKFPQITILKKYMTTISQGSFIGLASLSLKKKKKKKRKHCQNQSP